MQSPFESAALSTLPLFLTFDSHVPIADLNASSSAAPWRSQEAFVWGAAPDEAKIKAWRSVAPHAKLSYYMPYSRAPSASKGFGLSFWLREHPDWVLYRCDRKTVAYWDGESAPTGSVPLDFTNPDVIRWQVANQSKFAEAHGYDAMAFDNYGGGARQGANPGQACGVWLCNGTQWAYRFNQSGATFSTRQAAAVRNASIVWLELANHLMAQLTPSLGIIPNLCIDEPSKSRTPPDWAKSADAARVLKASTAVLSERGFTGWGSVRVSEAELLNEYAWMDRLAAAGKAYYSLNEVKGGVNASWAEWAIGAFLVGMQPRHSGLWLGGVQDYGGWSFSSPGLSARIGHPIDRRQQLDAGVWMRNFSGGVALINPRSATARIHVGAGALHGGWRNLTGGTASVDMSGALALGPASACVLLFGTTSSLDVMQMASSADADAVSPPDACFPKPTAAWCNTSIPFSERASLLVAALTLEERIQQLSTFTPSTVPGVARIGLPSFSYHSEGLHGLRNSFDTLSLNATLFPQTTALAASGDMDLVRRMGATMLQEARALSNFAEKRQLGPFGRGSGLFYWSPTMNLGRDPRWGRFQESVSEDPLVNGLYSAAFLQGFQGNDTRYLGVAATCKHMMAYSLEASGNATRHNFSATVSEQDLHETFVPAFQQCVLNGRPAQIMCAYNAINGIPACLRGDLINGLARKRWKFDGLVVSDQDSILDAWNGTRRHPGHFYGHSQENVSALAIRAGCDQNDGVTYAKSLAGAISRDLVATSDIDTALTRVLMQRFRVGAFDPPQLCPFRSIGTAVMDSPAHRALALEAARKGVVLLCNTDAALPLDAGDAHATTVAVIGPLANDTTSLAGGKPDYHPSFTISHLQGIQARMARFGGAPTYAAGCEGVAKCSQGAIKLATHAAAAATTTIIFVGIDGSIEHEGTDRTSIGLPPTQLDMLQRVTAAARGKVIVVLCNGGPLSIDWLHSAASTGSSNKQPVVHAVVEAFELGQSAGTALAEVLWGDTNPSGALPFTIYPEDFVDQVAMQDFSMRSGPGRTYRFYQGKALWPFGFGLSYTSWNVAVGVPATVRASTQDAALDGLRFNVRVTNVGSVAGARVLHAFVSEASGTDGPLHDDVVRSRRPVLTLWGLGRTPQLAPNEAATLALATNDHSACALCTVNSTGVRAVRAGTYTLRFGGDGGRGHSCGSAGAPCAEVQLVLSGATVVLPW